METVVNKKLDQFVNSLTSTSVSLPKEQLEQARALLDQKDFPTTRDEAWKYTRVGKIASIEASSVTETLEDAVWESFVDVNASATIILMNGRVHRIISHKNIDGLTITSMSDTSENKLSLLSEPTTDVFDALNLLYLDGGISIRTEKNVRIEAPLNLIHLVLGDQSIHHSRIHIDLAENSSLELVQQFIGIGSDTNHANNHTVAALADGAHLELHKMQTGLHSSYLVSRESIQQAGNSTFTLHTHTADSIFVRNDSTIRVVGMNAETNLFGSYLLKQGEHVDNHTCIDHLAPNCLSNELYKGVIGEKATAVFNGKVFVRKDAQKINAFQSNANVLTSDLATVNSKPELEIYADDVKCSHGSTTGQLDDEAIFYLRARGISEKAAKDLLIQAFLDDVFSKTQNEKVQELLQVSMKRYFN